MFDEMRGFKSRYVMFFVVLVAGALLGAVFITTYHHIQHDPDFCQTCHIMEEPFQKWSTSPHHLVDCHECHKQGIFAGVWQVWFYLTKRPEHVVHHPELDHKVCAQCHLSNDPRWKLVGETAGHKVHFEKAGIECLDCHMGSVHEIFRPVESCVSCHADKLPEGKKGMTFAHCTTCHNFLAKEKELIPGREVCLDCHRKVTIGEETFPSEAPMSSLACSTCHKPHEQLRPDNDVCLGCHADTKPPHHRMKETDRCSSCHKPHTWTSG